MAIFITIILALASFPIYVLFGRVIFGGTDEFGEVLDQYFRWELREWWEGRGPDYEWAKLRMGLFFASCGLVVVGEYQGVRWVIDRFFS